ncbi:ATP-dependent helicase HrpB [Glaciecola sp. 2405UD65-10]|uniref:ATP-dependent helicase HrpB n=1 Tax=Glaciecola sp. 2405UD65-10 TaxID=3397244 RepID=UPI003B58FC8A
MRTPSLLPIDKILGELSQQIINHDCILIAPPGAGKSTRLPLALLKLSCFTHKLIIMLQPRQVAARSIAQYLSMQLGQKVGQHIGYHVRGDAKYSTQTRLLIMTEGMLSARMQQDPELSDVALIIFDEFHERSIYSDIALGLALEIQQGLREDLRLLVMSATLEVKPVQDLLPLAKLLECEGRSYPIQYIYRPLLASNIQHKGQRNTKQFALRNWLIKVIEEAFEEHEGHILVFLSGASDIFFVQGRLKSKIENGIFPNTIVAPLLGILSAQEQQLAIDVPPKGVRKIVLATNIAETSLTIDGVSVVIDSGLEKVQKFNISRGTNMLVEQAISKASSTQRAGRAGRQQAGICYRLWDEQKQQYLVQASKPQITDMDISRELLMLKEWGSSFDDLPLIDKPSKAQVSAASDLLAQLGFINADKSLSLLGKKAAKFSTHPRLAKLLLLAQHEYHHDALLIIFIVSILEGKSISQDAGSLDIEAQIRFLQSNSRHPIHSDIKRWAKHFKIPVDCSFELSSLDNILLASFPDAIAKQKPDGGYLMSSGNGIEFHSALVNENMHIEWLICLEQRILSTHGGNAQISLFHRLSPQSIRNHINEQKTRSVNTFWDKQNEKIASKQVDALGAIILNEQAISTPNSAKASTLLMQHISEKGAHFFEHEKLIKVREFIMRLECARLLSANATIPNMSPLRIFDDAENWLLPFLHNITSMKQALNLEWMSIIKSRLDYSQQQELEREFPAYFKAPSGHNHPLHYAVNSQEECSVTLAIRMQELYGLNKAITVGNKHWPVTISILSPAQREIQKTQDLPGFWEGSYKAVQKEMKGRYPKHFWPDKPAHAKPTTKTKKNM